MSPNIDSPSSPLWVYSYIKLRFFTRIRRFLRAKASANARKRSPPSDTIDQQTLVISIIQEPATTDHQMNINDNRDGSDDDVAAGLQRAVKRLHFGGWPEKETAVAEIEALAKDDIRIRKLMVQLGVVPVLVTMAGSDVAPRRRAAVAALIQLANGTYTNKAIMVEAGILSKVPRNTNDVDEATKHGFSELLLTLSSLANTPFPLSPSKIVPFLVSILESTSTSMDTKHSCLATLYNLSTVLDNATLLVSNNVIDTLLKLLSSAKDLSEKVLATIANLAVTPMGKKAMESSPMVPESLIEALTWDEKPKCQESSAYILMILAHQSSSQRQKMSKLGIVGVLLEVALLSSPLAQKRALKLLQWFRDEKMGPHSGPQRMAVGSPVSSRRETREEGKRMMKSLVKQSLHKNMEMITRRATSNHSSNLKALVLSTSSKSLPY